MVGEALNKEKFAEGLMREMLWAEVPRTLVNYEKTRKELGEGFGEENQNQIKMKKTLKHEQEKFNQLKCPYK